VLEALAAAPAVAAPEPSSSAPVSIAQREEARQKARRVEAMSYKLAGLTWDQIGDRLEISADSAQRLVENAISRAVNTSAESLREVENARLDRMQAAVWASAIQGDHKSIALVLQIQTRRARLNGLDAPTRIDLAVGVRNEMEGALAELRQVVLGEVYSMEESPLRAEQSYDDRPVKGTGTREGSYGGVPGRGDFIEPLDD
jgi:hypothetical protein